VSTVAQLASGQSLRFALPLLALGALRLIALPRFVAAGAAVVAAIVLAFSIDPWWRVFASDATTHDVGIIVSLVALALAVLVLAGRRGLRVGALAAAGLIALAGWAAGLAASHPLDYLADRFDQDAQPIGAFAVLHALRPSHLVVAGLPSGAVVIAVPAARVDDAGEEACTQARAGGAMLVTTASDGCAGTLIYRDAEIRIVAPSRGERFP
jgi:hypothetical protein